MSEHQQQCGCNSCSCDPIGRDLTPAKEGKTDGYPDIVHSYADLYGLPTDWCDGLLEDYTHELSLASANCDWLAPDEFNPLFELATKQDSNIQDIITPDAGDIIEWADDPYLTSDIVSAIMAFTGEFILAVGHHTSTHQDVIEHLKQHEEDLGSTVIFSSETLPELCQHIGKEVYSYTDSYERYLQGWQFDMSTHGINELIGTTWTVYPAVDITSYRLLDQLETTITPESDGYSITGKLKEKDTSDEIFKDNRRLFDPPYKIHVDECGGEIPPMSPYDLSIYSEGDIIPILPGTLRYGTLHESV